MISFPPTLAQLIQTVPTCEKHVTLDRLLSLFQSTQSEAIVVVDADRVPVGTISCLSLMHYVIQCLLIKQSLALREMEEPTHSCLSEFDLTWLIEPIALLSAQTKVTDLSACLQTRQPHASGELLYAIVDAEGKFLGLLDRWRLLRSCLAGTEELSYSLAHLINASEQELLFQWLERIPVPLLVQAADGETLHRNLSWREHLAEFIPPPDAISSHPCSDPSQYWQVHSPALAWATEVDPLLDVQPECIQDQYFLAAQLSYRQLRGAIASPITVPAATSQLANPVSQRTWQFVKSPLKGATPPCLWLVLGTDVSEQQRLCQELAAQKADLLQLNQLKDEFLDCISHELKSPLTAVVGLSNLLKEQKIGDLNQRQTQYASLIYQSGRQLMTLVNDLLDLSRLEAGQLQLNRVPIEVEVICQQSYRLLQEKYQDNPQASIAFALEIEPGLDRLIADERRLQQMLVHLLDNALKFTGAEGQMGLKVSHWGNWMALTVWDTGMGIPEDTQHLLFHKFQHLESPVTGHLEGLGLGLRLAQRLARAHGGDISFISNAGQGSQFTVLLPSSPTGDRSTTEPSQPQSKSHPLVLVIETRAPSIQALAQWLVDLGYRAVIARTGIEALEKARQLQPHAILLNPTLPFLSGWDVLTLLKAEVKTRNIPVFVMSTPADQLLSQRKGAGGFLGLPVTLKSLQAALGQAGESLAPTGKSLTILRLHLFPEQGDCPAPLDLAFVAQLSALNHRVVEADDLEQAAAIARVWTIDALILDGTELQEPLTYLRSLGRYRELVTLPLITLDAQTTAAANQIGNLSVFPCLVPPSEQGFAELLQVLQIAVGH
jgi:signal transduction histidine kinase/DNA-binding response OmpR family regulator